VGDGTGDSVGVAVDSSGGVAVGIEVETAAVIGGVGRDRVSRKAPPPTIKQINPNPRTATMAIRDRDDMKTSYHFSSGCSILLVNRA
jgi:hypothetical protein